MIAPDVIEIKFKEPIGPKESELDTEVDDRLVGQGVVDIDVDAVTVNFKMNWMKERMKWLFQVLLAMLDLKHLKRLLTCIMPRKTIHWLELSI